MKDPSNPTDDELRQWAQDREPSPVQDFDLVVADVERVPLLIELASSPQGLFFLSCLYLVVGDAVRTDFRTATRLAIESTLDDAAQHAAQSAAILRWVADSRYLLAHPDTFDYEDWCDGGLAGYPGR